MDTGNSSRERTATRSTPIVTVRRAGAVEDPARPIVSAILTVVPASRWAFARINGEGVAERILSSASTIAADDLTRECKRQRRIAHSGSRIAATSLGVRDGEIGVTLLFADDRTTFGIMTLVRTDELGAFTSTEIRMLTLALGTTTDHLSLLRLHPNDDASPALEPARDASMVDDAEGAFYVLDRDFRIVLTLDSEDRRRIALAGLQMRAVDRLPAVLEQTVRELTAAWDRDGHRHEARQARPVPFLIVHAAPMAGPSGSFIGVRIERFRAPNSLTSAAAKYHISPREVQVLALLLDGRHLNEIGSMLHITSSTVQDHIRNMVEKTGSRNRSDLIARILGWEFAPATT